MPACLDRGLPWTEFIESITTNTELEPCNALVPGYADSLVEDIELFLGPDHLSRPATDLLLAIAGE